MFIFDMSFLTSLLNHKMSLDTIILEVIRWMDLPETLYAEAPSWFDLPLSMYSIADILDLSDSENLPRWLRYGLKEYIRLQPAGFPPSTFPTNRKRPLSSISSASSSSTTVPTPHAIHSSGSPPAKRRAQLQPPPQPRPPVQSTCSICFDTYRIDEMRSLPCDHLYCEDCIRGYLDSNIDFALEFACPEPSCRMEIPDEYVLDIVSNKRKYYLMTERRSLVAIRQAPNILSSLALAARRLSWSKMTVHAYNADVALPSAGNAAKRNMKDIHASRWLRARRKMR